MSSETSFPTAALGYCPACTSIVDDGERQACAHCETPRPPSGWPGIEESGHGHLGKVIDGRYRLEQFLGAGTSGTVYRARALRISRAFAMKIVDTHRYGKPEYQREMLRRFEREVDAMSRLRNPHIVNIYETIELPNDTFALVMDYVEGRTLQSMLDAMGRIAIDEVMEIVRQIANGLHEAHCAGIIHRDLKPENVMIEQLPASGFFARILDFGVAQMNEAVGETHGFRGTPLYASPEQCTEDPALDHRSDIYSLGCLFFHGLVGQPPFPHKSALRVMECHVEERAPTIFEVDPTLAVPEQLGALIAKMLAKKPADRPRDMSKVIEAIDAILEETPGLDETHGLEEATFGATPPVLLSSGPFVAPPVEDAVQTGQTALEIHRLHQLCLRERIDHPIQSVILLSLARQTSVCAAADNHNVIHVLSLGDDCFAQSYRGARGRLTALHLDAARGALYGADVDGTILGWDLGFPLQKPRIVARLDASIVAIDVSPTADLLYCGTERGHLASIDLRTQKQKTLVRSGPAVSALCYGPKTRHLIAAQWDGGIKSVRMGEDLHIRDYAVVDRPIFAMALDPNEANLALVDDEGTLTFFDPDRARTIYTACLAFKLRALVYNAPGRVRALGHDGTTLELWELVYLE